MEGEVFFIQIIFSPTFFDGLCLLLIWSFWSTWSFDLSVPEHIPFKPRVYIENIHWMAKKGYINVNEISPQYFSPKLQKFFLSFSDEIPFSSYSHTQNSSASHALAYFGRGSFCGAFDFAYSDFAMLFCIFWADLKSRPAD